ncbi:MAG: hypothetical protein WBG90_21855, partial [Saonia sp.]
IEKTYDKLQKLTLAHEYYDKAKELVSPKNKMHYAHLLNNMAEHCVLENNLKSALMLLEQALVVYKEILPSDSLVIKKVNDRINYLKNN